MQCKSNSRLFRKATVYHISTSSHNEITKILASNRKGYETYYSVQDKRINTLIEVLLGQKSNDYNNQQNSKYHI